MMRSFGKVISMMLVLMLVAMLAPANIIIAEPLEGEDPVRVLIPFENYGHARGDGTNASKAQKYSTNSNYGQRYIQTSGSWVGYAQLDLSGYEEILKNPSTKTRIKLMAGNGFTSYAFNFWVYTAPDKADGYDYLTLTYNQAKNMGIDDNTRPVIASRTDDATVVSDSTMIFNDGIKNGVVVSLDADKDNIISVIGESDTNGLITLFFKGSSNAWLKKATDTKPTTYGTVFTMADKNGKVSTGLEIEYYKSEIENGKYLEDLEKDFTWENLSSDSASDFKTSLPNYFRGANIEWSASSDELNILPDGTFKRPRSGDVSATLTAKVSLGDASFTKTFDVIAPQNHPMVVTVNGTVNDCTFVDSSRPNEAVGIYEKTIGYKSDGTPIKGGSYDNYEVRNYGLYKPGKSDKMAFFKWDLSGYEDILDVATNIGIKWTNRYDVSTAPFTLTVMNNVNNSWTNGTLTYDIAVETGMYTDPGVYSLKDLSMEKTTSIESPALAEGFRKALSQNPENSIVSIKFVGQTDSNLRFRNTGRAYNLTITYYADDLKSDGELISSQLNNMPWSAISSQDINNVITDIKLPKTLFGKTVTWTSSDDAIINSSTGEVVPGDGDVTVKLTASVTNSGKKYTKDFDVTVTSNTDYILGSTKGDYVNAYVWSKKPVDSCAVVVASYENNELVKVNVRENSALVKGENYIWTDCSGKKESKIMLLENLSSIKPLAVAK